MDAINELVMTSPNITYYGPHPCDKCGEGLIVRGSVEQGWGSIRLDYPDEQIIYPNHQWKEHVCAKAAKAEADHELKT